MSEWSEPLKHHVSIFWNVVFNFLEKDLEQLRPFSLHNKMCLFCLQLLTADLSSCNKQSIKSDCGVSGCVLLFIEIGLDVLQHGEQLLLHLSFWNCHLCTWISPHCNALMLLHIFRTHFQTDRNPLNGRQTVKNWLADAELMHFVSNHHHNPLLLFLLTLSSQWLNFHPGE